MIPKPKSVGSDNPQVLFILGEAKPNEIKECTCMSTDSGLFLSELLAGLDLVGYSRFTNVTVTKDSIEGLDIQEDIDPQYYVSLLKDEISTYHPKLLVGLGKKVHKYLGVTEVINGELVQITINGVIYNYLPLASPTYIMYKYSEPSITDEYIKSLDKIRLYLGLESKVNATNALEKLSKCHLMQAYTYSEFENIYTQYFKDKKLVSYDIETNAEPIYSQNSRIVGFSLAYKDIESLDDYQESNIYGVYVLIDSVDYHMTESDRINSFKLLTTILSQKRIVVHNSAYERPYTHHCLSYYMTYDQTEDTLVLARLLNGGTGRAGLKIQAQSYLGYPDWETDLSAYLDIYSSLLTVLFDDKKKYRVYDAAGNSIKLKDVDNLWKLYELAQFNYNTKGESDQSDDNIHYLVHLIDSLKSILISYYKSNDEISKVINDLGEYMTVHYNSKYKSYECIPSRLISKYGALDSIATIDLYHYYSARLSAESTDEVDLHQGYENWKEHMYAGTVLERNGLHWNDRIASSDYQEFQEIKLRNLKYLIKSPLSRTFIMHKCYQQYLPRAITEFYSSEFALREGITIHDYDRDTGKFTLYLNGKRAARSKLFDIQYPSEFKDKVMDTCYQYLLNEIDTVENESDLIAFYNPKSSVHAMLPKSIFNTDQRLKLGHWIWRISTLYHSPSMEEFRETIEKGTADPYEIKFFGLLELLQNTQALKEDNINPLDIIATMTQLASNLSNPQYNVQTEDLELDITEMNEPSVIDIATWYFNTGIDIEDRHTWTPEFEWLYYFREYKKVDKLLTSYIEGSVGRKSVYIVDKEELQSGSKDVSRLRTYDSSYDTESEDFILGASWGVNTAETGRWKGGMHTIPWNSPSRYYYDSRFKGGTIVAPDYSQMEVRALAASANETTMLQAYEEGADIHALTASRIWNKPIDEVAPAERRFSKMACNVGTNKVKLADGTIKTFTELYETQKDDFYVYSYDIENQRIAPGHVVGMDLTKYVTDTVKVTFSNHQSIEVTPDHPILTLSGSYVEAQNLVKGDKIESLFYKADWNSKYEQIRDTKYKYSVGSHIRYGRWEYTHLQFSDYLGDVFPARNISEIKHIDGNIYNNELSNLVNRSVYFANNPFSNRVVVQILEVLSRIGRKVEWTESNYESRRNYGEPKWHTLHKYYSIDKWKELRDKYMKMRDHYADLLSNPLRGNPIFHIPAYPLSEIACLKVTNIEHIHYEDPVPVYDLAVKDYHNYALDLGNNSGVFVHNTFSILYGSSEYSFANNFCDGDMKKAHEIMEGFYRAYPEIKKWTEARHQEMETTGKVSLKSNRFINISPKTPEKSDVEAAYRKAGNYPIQGMASDMAGCVLYELCKYLDDHSYKSKPFMFVHDSLEVDIYPYELIDLLEKFNELLYSIPRTKFGIPAKADFTLGKSLGHELDLDSLDQINEDKTEAIITLKGYQDEILDTINTWKLAYKTVEIKESEFEDEYVPLSDMFIPKKSYTKWLGKTRQKGYAKVYINYYK